MIIYLFLILAIVASLVTTIVVTIRFGRRSGKISEKILAWLGASFFIGCFFLLIIATAWSITEAVLFSGLYALVSILFLLIIFRCLRKKGGWITLTALTVAFIAAFCIQGYWLSIDNAIPTVSDSVNLLDEYTPNSGKLAHLNEPAELSITENCPKLDGATALYPVYAAFANELYPADVLNWPDSYDWDKNSSDIALACSTTVGAYRSLVNGITDVIFVAAPSEEQLQYAADCGEEMIFTPIGREAFVFFVNSENPVEGLTAEQIRSIYSGETTRWNDLGADLGKIIAFQRDEGSGSQSALIRFMGDTPLMKARTDTMSGSMGGIIEQVADYKNYKNAIGYSFRFYSTEMVSNNQIKLLAINGVAPTKENVLNNTYPIASEFYAVHLASNDNPNIQPLIDWILSEQGQSLIDQTGYVALRQ